MSTVAFAVLLQVSVVVTGSDSYAEAHRTVAETGKPLVILVGAKWCPACKVMQREIMPEVQRQGLLRRVAYAFVDLDREQSLGRQLTEDDNGLIPQVIMYRKTRQGWLRRRLVGAQDVETVETFINQGLSLDRAAKRSDTDHPSRGSGTREKNSNT